MSAVIEEQKETLWRHGHHDVLIEMEEALRLHPHLVMLFRQNHSDFFITTREGKSYTIPKGHIVGTSPAMSCRLPHVYKDPDMCSPGNEEHGKAGQFCYISFGGGGHGCLGESFAYMQVGVV
jgi:sterol 14-demethylase